MSNGTATKEQTINDVLADCHQVCVGIEERLSAIVAPPSLDKEPADVAQRPDPDTVVDFLGQGHLRAASLCTRLRRIEEHLAHARDLLRALA